LIKSKGYLKKINCEKLVNKNMIEENEMKTSILFDKSKDLVTKIKPAINTATIFENNLFFYNEKKVNNFPKLN